MARLFPPTRDGSVFAGLADLDRLAPIIARSDPNAFGFLADIDHMRVSPYAHGALDIRLRCFGFI